jgi:hypothetical protein
MTMWSENHQILFGQSQLLAGELYRDLEFARSGFVGTEKLRTGRDHIKEGIARVERWLDLRLKFGFSEWNAPGYYNEDFPPLFNLVDFCNPDDPAIKDPNEALALGRIRTKASMVRLVSPAVAAGPASIHAAAIEAAGKPSAKILAGLFQVR